MLLTHQFGSQETMNRARFWLTWHGFEVQESRPNPAEPARSHSRLAVRVNFSAAAAVRSLIDSLEHSDTNACPGLHDSAVGKTWRVDAPTELAPFGANHSTGTPIHWQAADESTGDAVAARMSEYMFSRSE